LAITILVVGLAGWHIGSLLPRASLKGACDGPGVIQASIGYRINSTVFGSDGIHHPDYPDIIDDSWFY